MERTMQASYSAQNAQGSRFSTWLAKIDIPAYEKGEDLFNAVSHLLGVLLGLFGIGFSLGIMITEPLELNAIIGILVYCVSLIALYAVSGVYHLLKPSNAKRIMRVMDHCTIYILIAGCYTPVALVAFWGYSWAPIILIAEWVIALLGIAINVFDMTAMPVKVFSIISYLAMGWMIMLVPFDLLLNMGVVWMPWIVAGGLAYTSGLIFYGLGSKKRYMHCVWHVFVLAGSILQFVGFIQMI